MDISLPICAGFRGGVLSAENLPYLQEGMVDLGWVNY